MRAANSFNPAFAAAELTDVGVLRRLVCLLNDAELRSLCKPTQLHKGRKSLQA